MKSIQRLAILFLLILLPTFLIIEVSRQEMPGEWLLIFDHGSQNISVFEPSSTNYIPIEKLPVDRALFIFVSPDRRWLYYQDRAGQWGRNLRTSESRFVFANEYHFLDLRGYISPDGKFLMYYDRGKFKRFEFNTATEQVLDISLAPSAINVNFSDIRTFLWWTPDGECAYILWQDDSFYCISRDGKAVEPFDFLQMRLSPNENWFWEINDMEYFVVDRHNDTRIPIPVKSVYNVWLDWTPDSTLILRHGSSNPLITSISQFRDGQWNTIADEIIGIETQQLQRSSLSPDHTYYLYYRNNDHLYLFDLVENKLEDVGPATPNYFYWHESGEWFAYMRFENINVATLSYYDLNTNISTDIHTFRWSGGITGLEIIEGTNLISLRWANTTTATNILIDAKTRQAFELDPDNDVISRWNLAANLVPQDWLYILIGLLLIGVPLAMSAIQRRLSA